MIWPTDYINQVIQGDCLEVMKGIPDKSIDAVITDPPFAFAGGLSNGRSSIADDQFFLYWWKDICTELDRVLKPEGAGFIWCDWRTAAIIAKGFNLGQTYNWKVSQVIYHYREMPGQGKPFRSSVDMIAYCRGEKCKNTRIPNTTHNMISKYWYYGKHKNHPAEKDPEICKQLLCWCSDKGMIVLDPFFGSGTTGVAAKLLGRQFIGIEISEKYCQIARQRIDQALVNKKLNFTEVAYG